MAPTVLGIGVAERMLGPSRGSVEGTVDALRSVHAMLAREMGAVIGDVGFDAAFTRCIRKARAEHECLGDVALLCAPDALLEPLWACLGRLDVAASRAVAIAILARFFDLMATFLGRDLTLRLFHHTWPDALPSPREPRRNDDGKS